MKKLNNQVTTRRIQNNQAARQSYGQAQDLLKISTSQTSQLDKVLTQISPEGWYGTLVDTSIVHMADKFCGQIDRDMLRAVESYKLMTYTVPDNQIGLQAVAMSCGYGMPNCIDEHNLHYEDYLEMGLSRTKGGKLRFTQPVIALSAQTAGFRAVWGGVLGSKIATYEVDDPANEDASVDWEHDIYLLRTNLADGGIIVQSSSSGAYILAEKQGNTWKLSLQLPVVTLDEPVNGHSTKVVGRGYEGVFLSGFYYFRDKSQQATDTCSQRMLAAGCE